MTIKRARDIFENIYCKLKGDDEIREFELLILEALYLQEVKPIITNSADAIIGRCPTCKEINSVNNYHCVRCGQKLREVEQLIDKDGNPYTPYTSRG